MTAHHPGAVRIDITHAALILRTGDFPSWLTVLSIASLVVAIALAGWTASDVLRRPQPMRVMSVVWPVTMLFGGPLWLWFYLRWGRAASRGSDPVRRDVPLRVSVLTGASHCGAGCALGDLVGELGLLAVPGLAAVVGLGSLYSDRMYAGWVVDFVAAYLIGIAFQYFAIAPMVSQPARRSVWQAVKADTLSITSWQVGMYGSMALAQLVVLPALAGGRAAVLSAQFWWVMQLAMLAGFVTAYPVNWWLIRIGVKETMGAGADRS